MGYQKPDSKERCQQDLTKSQFLANMYQYFKNALSNSKPAKDYLLQRSLDFKKIEIGYNSGQFHHGARKDENVIAQCVVSSNSLSAISRSRLSVLNKIKKVVLNGVNHSLEIFIQHFSK